MEVNTGKIKLDFFKQFIQNKCGKNRKEISTKPNFGVDVSVINLPNNQAIATASDPLSLIPSLGLKESAWLSVQLTANDIATTGFSPMYGQFILNLPASLSKQDFQVYWDYIHQFCSEIGIAITGGHTGFVEGNNTTICGGATFMTIAAKEEILTSQFAKPGDVILMTKNCAISATAILAKSFPKTVINKAGKENYQTAADSFYETSSLKDALIAKNAIKKGVTAMHDVTEGGVLGAVYEMAIASGNGALIDNKKLPIQEAQTAICDVFSLDPRYCIGAGAMIITCKREAVDVIKSALHKENISCSEIGVITEKSKGIKLLENNHEKELHYFTNDPYWEAFYKAFKSGWK